MLASRSDVANRMNMRVRHRHIHDDAGSATLGGDTIRAAPPRADARRRMFSSPCPPPAARQQQLHLRCAIETDPVIGHFDTQASL